MVYTLVNPKTGAKVGTTTNYSTYMTNHSQRQAYLLSNPKTTKSSVYISSSNSNLTMATATTARSSKGTSDLIGEMQRKINNVINELSGQSYKDLEIAVNNNWSGQSKENFMKDLTSKITSITNELNSLKTKINDDISADNTAFLNADANIYQSH